MAEAFKIDVHVEGKGTEVFGKISKGASDSAEKLDRYARAEQKAAAEAKNLTQASLGMEGALRSIGTLLGVSLSMYGLKLLTSDAIRGTVELGHLGMQAITVRDSFDYMTRSVGLNGDMLASLQNAAGGTINSLKLMELSNMALVGLSPAIGNALASSEARLIEISRAALKANPAIGSVEFAYNSLVLGVKRLEKRLVDNIGLQVKVNDANEKYAESIGKNVDALSAEDKQMAMLNAILEGGGRLIQQIGGDVSSLTDKTFILRTAWQELRIEMGKKFAIPVAEAETDLARLLRAGKDIITEGAVAANVLASAKEQLAIIERTPVDFGAFLSGSKGVFPGQNAKDEAIAAQKEYIAQLEATGKEARRAAEWNAYFASTSRDTAAAVRTSSSSVNTLRVNLLNLNGVMPVIANSMSRLAGVARAMATDFSGTALLGFTDVMSIKEYSTQTQNLATYEKGLEVAVSMGMMTRQEADYQLRKYTDSLTDHYGALQKTTTATEKLSDAERELQSAISSAVAPSFAVDELAPGLVGREDAIDEHYRRLAAIALRGQEEIDKHNVDWADTISQIPAEVRAKGIEAMQAWAKEKVIAYGKGLDTSLVNRERIKQLVMEQIQANKMRDELVNEIYAEMGGAVSLKDVQAAAGDVTGTGSAMGQAISTGVKDSIDVDGMLKTTASAINTGATKYAAQLKTSGGSVGGIILDGITTAVVSGAPDIIKKLAKELAPSVATEIENNARRSGQ